MERRGSIAYISRRLLCMLSALGLRALACQYTDQMVPTPGADQPMPQNTLPYAEKYPEPVGNGLKVCPPGNWDVQLELPAKNGKKAYVHIIWQKYQFFPKDHEPTIEDISAEGYEPYLTVFSNVEFDEPCIIFIDPDKVEATPESLHTPEGTQNRTVKTVFSRSGDKKDYKGNSKKVRFNRFSPNHRSVPVINFADWY